MQCEWCGCGFEFNIELSSRLRKPESGLTGKPTELAYRFCDHLAAALSDQLG
jgi:hypothetical protein